MITVWRFFRYCNFGDYPSFEQRKRDRLWYKDEYEDAFESIDLRLYRLAHHVECHALKELALAKVTGAIHTF
jgi:hypothetical protein